jgi:hypothetical protein
MSLFFCALLLILSQGSSTKARQTAARNPTSPEIIFVATPEMVAGDLARRLPEGSRVVRLDTGRNPARTEMLTPRFFAAADPQLSFDGTHVLFSGQEAAGQRWQVWEMNADGSGQKQITKCPDDCLRADYLPQDEVVYTARTIEEGRSEWQLMVSKRDGSDARAITFGPGDFQAETVLRNGLIVASASWPLDATGAAAKTRQLYTIKPDGTELESLRYENAPTGIRTEAAELDDGAIVFEKLVAGNPAPGGRLMEIKRGALRGAPLGLQTAMSWSPSEFTGDGLIASRWMAGGRRIAGKFDLYSFDVNTGSYGRRIYGDPRFSSLEAVAVTARAVPKWFWSLVEPEAKVGRLICLDSYLSGDEPEGRIDGTIAQVRVLTLERGGQREKSLGEAPVESDGSFYIAVPPDRPVRFELLDPDGRVLRAQKGWVWARPGEDRGCAGCHEDRAVAPENRWPLTLKRLDTPTPMGTVNVAGKKP